MWNVSPQEHGTSLKHTHPIQKCKSLCTPWPSQFHVFVEDPTQITVITSSTLLGVTFPNICLFILSFSIHPSLSTLPLSANRFSLARQSGVKTLAGRWSVTINASGIWESNKASVKSTQHSWCQHMPRDATLWRAATQNLSLTAVKLRFDIFGKSNTPQPWLGDRRGHCQIVPGRASDLNHGSPITSRRPRCHWGQFPEPLWW